MSKTLKRLALPLLIGGAVLAVMLGLWWLLSPTKSTSLLSNATIVAPASGTIQTKIIPINADAAHEPELLQIGEKTCGPGDIERIFLAAEQMVVVSNLNCNPEIWTYDGVRPPRNIFVQILGETETFPHNLTPWGDGFLYQANFQDVESQPIFYFDLGTDQRRILVENAHDFSVWDDTLIFQTERPSEGEQSIYTIAALSLNDETPRALTQYESVEGLNLSQSVGFNGDLYISMGNWLQEPGLYRLDRGGSLAQLPSSCGSSGIRSARSFTPFQGNLVFSARDWRGAEPWVYDGQTAPCIIADINTNPRERYARDLDDPPRGQSFTDSSLPMGFAIIDDHLVFAADAGFNEESGESYPEAWSLSQMGVLLKIANVGEGLKGASANLEGMIAATATTFFMVQENAETGREIWAYSPTSQTAWPLDLMPGPAGSYPRNLFALGQTLYFSTSQGLWSHTQASGIQLLTDVQSDRGLDGAIAAVFQGRLYFAGKSRDRGDGVWSIPAP